MSSGSFSSAQTHRPVPPLTEGAVGAYSIEEMVKALKSPRVLWAMVPAGEATQNESLSATVPGALASGERTALFLPYYIGLVQGAPHADAGKKLFDESWIGTRRDGFALTDPGTDLKGALDPRRGRAQALVPLGIRGAGWVVEQPHPLIIAPRRRGPVSLF